MAAEVEKINSAMNSLQVSDAPEQITQVNGTGNLEESSVFPLEELYRLAVAFYKDKEGKAIHLTYKDKLRFVALTKQVSFGKYRTDASPAVGFLDVVGNDRRQAWQGLGDMSRESAMSEFIKNLDKLCPLFKPYVQAHKAEKEEQDRKRQEEEERSRKEEEEKERIQLEQEVRNRQEEERQKQLQQEMQIRAALNQQTAIQFRQYAEQQFPSNPEQQEVLIKQLQEQHYQQYMQRVYQQQLLHQQQQYQQLQAMADSPQNHQVAAPQNGADGGAELSQIQQTPSLINTNQAQLQFQPDVVNGTDALGNLPEAHVNSVSESDIGLNHDGDDGDEDNENDEQNDLPPIAAASMWTRKDLKEFKDSIRKDPDSVIKVGSGETVTVRVPTHEDGTCLFWEFATDSYDLGFGVYFEWTVAPSNQVSVHVSESSDDEEIDEDDGGENKGDIEKGGSSKKDNRPPTDEIIPVYRRDCHDEVYCGSHMYPGRGVYLLKFDNSYSLWRSKTLYYRVYYTR